MATTTKKSTTTVKKAATVGGKTFAQASAGVTDRNKLGAIAKQFQSSSSSNSISPSTSKTSSSTKSSSSSSSKAGIINKPSASISGYSTAPAKATGMSVNPKQSTVTPNAINSSKSNVVTYKPTAPTKTSTFGNPFDGGFLKNVVAGAKSAFGGAKEAVKNIATAANTAIKKGNFAADASGTLQNKVTTVSPLASKTVTPTTPGLDFSGQQPRIETIQSSKQYQREQTQQMAKEDQQAAIVNKFLASTGQQTNPVMTSGGSGIQKVGSKASSALDTPVTTQTTTATNPDGSTTETSTTGPSSSMTPAPTVYNPNTVAGAANAISVLTDSLNQSKNDPYNKYNQKGDMIKYTETALNNLANQYSDPQQALNDYQSNPEYKAQIDAMTKLTGKTINDVAARITPVTNGIQPSQTTAEYLAKSTGALEPYRKDMNAILNEQAQFNAQQIKIITDGLQKEKDEATTLVDFYTEQETKKEKSEREKAQFAIQKAQAEYDAADAETEMNRVIATDNLKNFLAKIGALQTDGAAGVGLATLEQKYQAQRAALRSNFQLAKREIEINMNDHLNQLESDRDEKIFKLNQDLSRSEREISLDVMKLNHDTQKDILEAKLKYSEAIRTEKEKAAKKAADALNKYEMDFFDSAASKAFFQTLPSAVQDKFTQNAISASSQGRNVKASIASLKFFNANNPKPTEDVGSITPGDLAKGVTYMINKGASKSEIERFKTDREAQAYILEQMDQ